MDAATTSSCPLILSFCVLYSYNHVDHLILFTLFDYTPLPESFWIRSPSRYVSHNIISDLHTCPACFCSADLHDSCYTDTSPYELLNLQFSFFGPKKNIFSKFFVRCTLLRFVTRVNSLVRISGLIAEWNNNFLQFWTIFVSVIGYLRVRYTSSGRETEEKNGIRTIFIGRNCAFPRHDIQFRNVS